MVHTLVALAAVVGGFPLYAVALGGLGGPREPFLLLLLWWLYLLVACVAVGGAALGWPGLPPRRGSRSAPAAAAGPTERVRATAACVGGDPLAAPTGQPGPADPGAESAQPGLVWHGTPEEARALLQAVVRHCTCPEAEAAVAGELCPTHQLLACDQATLDRLLFSRYLADRLRSEEFGPGHTWAR